MKILSFIIAALMVLLAFRPAQAQFSVTDFPFIEDITHPYARALGEADITGYFSGGLSHLNPAFSGTRNFVRIGSNFTPRFLIVPDFKTQPNRDYAPEIFFVTPHVGVQVNRWDVSYQFRYYDLGEFRNESGTLIDGAEGVQEFTASYAVSDRFNVGASLNFYQSDRGYDPRGATSGVTMHLGVIFREALHFPNYSLYSSMGWSLTHFGRAREYALGAGNTPQPTTMRLGGSLRLELPQTYRNFRLFSVTAHTAFSRLVIGYNQNTLTPYGSFEALLRSWENYMVRDGDNFVEITLIDQIRRHVGLELEIMEVVKLRGGYRNRPDDFHENIRWTAGIGIDLDYIRLDASHVLGDFSTEYGKTIWMLTVAAPLEWVITSFGEE